MSAVESYYQYKVSLNKTDLVVGQNYIVDKRETTVRLANNTTQTATWYQFRIPINKPEDPENIINDMSGFTSIRFMRMFLTKFKIPVVLRGLASYSWSGVIGEGIPKPLMTISVHHRK